MHIPLFSFARRGAATAALFVPLVLAGCGGAAGDAQAPPPSARLPELAGRVTNGATETDVKLLQITVKGSVGTARTAEGRLAPVDGHDYLASLDQLSGPYLISDSARSPSSRSLYSVATGPGVANLTPLTTLVVAQLLGAEPGPYYEALGVRGGFTAADAAAVAAAEQQVRRYLQREHGFVVPASLGSFITTPFARTAGDPMYDTVTSFVTRVGTNGDVGAVVSAIAQESARCKAESVSVSGSGGSDAFCPFSKATVADTTDASVQVVTFSNRRGDTLVLRLRGTAVLDLRFSTLEGLESACAGAGCTGVTVGPPAADASFALTFAGTSLAGSAGPLALNGSLRAAAPGIPLPGLPCTDNRFYLIDEAAGRADGFCSAPDGFGLGASGQSLASGVTRRKFTFGDGVGGPSLEVMVQDATVISALVYTTDPTSGLPSAQFRCTGAACAGIVLGTPTVDQSLGVPVVLQPVTITKAVLPAVLPDGTLSTTASITLEGGLVGSWVNDPAALPFVSVACPAGAPTVTVLQSEAATPLAVCEPADTQGFTLRSTTVDADGNLVLNLASLLTDGAGFGAGNGVSVTIDTAGTVLAVSFDGFAGVSYRCSGAACAGVTAAPPDGLGARAVSFNGTVLTEVGTAGLAGDRGVVLSGGFVALPPP